MHRAVQVKSNGSGKIPGTGQYSGDNSIYWTSLQGSGEYHEAGPMNWTFLLGSGEYHEAGPYS